MATDETQNAPSSVAPTEASPTDAPLLAGAGNAEGQGNSAMPVVSLLGASIGPEGRYAVEARIGVGGFAETYMARDRHLNRVCVIKRLLVERQYQPSLAASIEHEAQTLVALNQPGHQHIPEIYDYLAEQGSLVMKYIDGQSLTQRAAQQGGRLEVGEVLRYGQAIGDALAYMHQRREPVLHRDIKPANILLDQSGRIWLIDFGFSRSFLLSGNANEHESMGTLGFTPPEQWRGQAVPQSDIYALGATMLVLLTGYQAERSTFLRIASGAAIYPSAQELNPLLSPRLSALLSRMLAPEPVARPDASELLQELTALQAVEQPTPRPVRKTTGSDISAEERNAKELVAKLINSWVERSGLRKQHVATRAGFADYGAFYRAYLDMSRGLLSDADRAVGVIGCFAEGLASDQRCTASEAVAFCIQVRLPLDRMLEVAAFFEPQSWQSALEPYLGSAPSLQAVALNERVAQIIEAIERSVYAPEQNPEALLANLRDYPGLPEPGPLPGVQRVVLARNRLFVGREAELRQLAAMLYATSATQGGAVAITGMGGLGKTDLANEFTHRYGRFFAGGVFWLNCSEPQGLALEVADCGQAMSGGADWAGLSLEERVRRTRAAWQEPVPRLLVFDNCEHASILTSWRPTTGGARVLLTSHKADWPRSLGVESLALEPLPRNESLLLLGRYRPDLAVNLKRMNGLAAELGDLPLALHLAGSFLENYQGDPQLGQPTGLLNELRSTHLIDHDMLHGVDSSPSATGHDLHIGRTFAVSLAYLDPNDPQDRLARTVLARSAWLAAGMPMSRTLLARIGQSDESSGQRELSRAIKRLVGLGLLAEKEDRFRLHPLLAAYTQRTLSDSEGLAICEQALIQFADQVYEEEQYDEGRLALPHLQWLADSAIGRTDQRAAGLWNALPFLLEVIGDRLGSMVYLERALAALVQSDQLESAFGADVLNNLGVWYFDLGHYEKARSFHERAYAVRQRIFPPEHLAIGESLHNMADSYRETGEFATAIGYLHKAARVWEALGVQQTHRALATTNNLGLLLLRMERYGEARDQFLALLQVGEQALGSSSWRLASTRSNLAYALHMLGEQHAAREELDLALHILRNRFDPQHPELIKPRLYDALLIAVEQGVNAGAEAMRSVLIDAEAQFGPAHVLVQQARAQLAAWAGTEAGDE
jgi:tRNA A-37 threonylcarbamoyl transferase component Bud32/tetratricopeptide (TPR) repeat protein